MKVKTNTSPNVLELEAIVRSTIFAPDWTTFVAYGAIVHSCKTMLWPFMILLCSFISEIHLKLLLACTSCPIPTVISKIWKQGTPRLANFCEIFQCSQGRRKVWKSGVARTLLGGDNVPPLVEIGVTDLPKSGGGGHVPPRPPACNRPGSYLLVAAGQ